MENGRVGNYHVGVGESNLKICQGHNRCNKIPFMHSEGSYQPA